MFGPILVTSTAVNIGFGFAVVGLEFFQAVAPDTMAMLAKKLKREFNKPKWSSTTRLLQRATGKSAAALSVVPLSDAAEGGNF